MTDDLGRVASQPGSHASHGAGQAVSALTGFDPSRIYEAMRRYLLEARAEGVWPVRWSISEPLARNLSQDEARPAILFGLPISVHDEWAWGWMLQCKSKAYDFDRDARFWSPSSDSDTHPQGGDAHAASFMGSAGPKDIAR